MHPNASTKEIKEADMNTIPSNSKFKPKLLKLIIALLIILTAVQFTTPITTYAQEDYEKNGSDGSGDGAAGESLNGTGENGSTKTLSYLYWAGSQYRTGYIMYVVDTSTDYGQIDILIAILE